MKIEVICKFDFVALIKVGEVGYEFEVHRDGKVISMGSGKSLKGADLHGYNVISIGKINGKTLKCVRHRMIATAFIDKFDELHEINHINGNRSDNRTDNLEWVSRSDNMIHKFRVLKRKPVGLGKNNGGSGVTRVSNSSKWQVIIRRFKKNHYLGCYSSKKKALAVAKNFEMENRV